jgi:8-amino-7-oxononanoate synthase
MSRPLPWLSDELQRLDREGLLRRRRRARWLPDGMCEIDGRRVCNFIGNDYLNLAADPRVVEAAAKALRQAGVGARASALLAGRTEWHVRLEETLADFEGEEAALLFPTGMAANLGVLPALIRKEDVVFCDRLNHASLIDGCRLTGAKRCIYRHDDLDALERELRRAGDAPRRWIVTDGVFSMDGDLAPLPELGRIAETYRAELIVDEAHATGVFGEHGRGTAEHFGVEDRVAVRIGTLSKGVGALGGFVAGSQALVDFLWNSARTQIFSTALPPAVCAAAETAVNLMRSEPERRARLHARAESLRRQLAERGIEVLAGSTGPILPVVVGEPNQTVELAARLEARGHLVGAIRPPSVPRGTSRLRISVSAGHTEAQLAALADAIADEWSR